APGSGEHQPLREAVLEVPRDTEAGEHTAERRGLQEHEYELERRVTGREVEARNARDLRQPARERREEEEWEEHRRKQNLRVRKGVLQGSPRDALDDVHGRHVRVIRSRRALDASLSEMSPSAITKPNPSASAVQSQPVMMRLRTHSIMYETGFSVAAMRNQSTPMSFRGVFIDEMNRKTKSTGK